MAFKKPHLTNKQLPFWLPLFSNPQQNLCHHRQRTIAKKKIRHSIITHPLRRRWHAATSRAKKKDIQETRSSSSARARCCFSLSPALASRFSATTNEPLLLRASSALSLSFALSCAHAYSRVRAYIHLSAAPWTK